MELQQLRYVNEIAKCGSISRAAKRLYTSQPNLSKSVKELEAEIGVPLFRRTVQGVELTLSGEKFLVYARNILAQMSELSAVYQNRKNSNIYLSVSAPRASYISSAFNRWASRRANGSFHLLYHETNPMSVINSVSANETQVGILRYNIANKEYFEGIMSSRGLSQDVLWEFSMVLIMDKKHPLAEKEHIDIDELEKYAEIVHGDVTVGMLPVTEANYDKSEKISGLGNQIEVFDRAAQFELLNSVSGSYMWVSPVPKDMLKKHGLVQKCCIDSPVYRDTAVWRATLDSEASAFLDSIRDQISELI